MRVILDPTSNSTWGPAPSTFPGSCSKLSAWVPLAALTKTSHHILESFNSDRVLRAYNLQRRGHNNVPSSWGRFRIPVELELISSIQ
ncbi:hypothetical protein PAXRUDRAFT_808403 [Paxillus rubicundulus Ve08.2h10]|uniref:Uncharacterized protein n=1 Tax=Paxillus rubicundulus Ve08.2h10 TaxID=930991 RepID=A0A0D0D049_9AGAM|nr:hypothetical protein PAXRUDRAFT_808403 [Paxillus rubicundulus Ve08.2h10]